MSTIGLPAPGAPRDEDFSALSRIDEHYPQLRRYSPELLETFQFQAAPVARNIIDAVELLREMNRNKLSSVPANASRAFVRKGRRNVYSVQMTSIGASMSFA